MSANVPQDIIIDILFRLPVKSIARFRCVSKPWLSILTHSKFIKTHLNIIRGNEKLLAFYHSDSLHALTLNSQNHYISTKLNFPPNLDRNWLKIVGSCQGLVLALNRDEQPKGMFLINPTTSNYNKLPRIPFNLHQPSFCMYGFGYDECRDDFKIVRLSCYVDDYDDSDVFVEDELDDHDTFVDVYSLKANCWTRIEVSPFDHISCVDASGVLLHDAIHWSACTRTDYSPVIVAFDLSTEKFRVVEVPGDIDDAQSSFNKLVVLEYCLCIVSEDYRSGIDVWMMKEYGVQGSWIKLIRVSNGFDRLIHVRLVGEHELVVSKLDTGELEIFNVKEERFRSFVVDGAPAMFWDGWTFVESLVSPNLNC